jgi:hypothetical protein
VSLLDVPALRPWGAAPARPAAVADNSRNSYDDGRRSTAAAGRYAESMHWATLVDFDKPALVSALSGLLTHLLRHCAYADNAAVRAAARAAAAAAVSDAVPGTKRPRPARASVNADADADADAEADTESDKAAAAAATAGSGSSGEAMVQSLARSIGVRLRGTTADPARARASAGTGAGAGVIADDGGDDRDDDADMVDADADGYALVLRRIRPLPRATVLHTDAATRDALGVFTSAEAALSSGRSGGGGSVPTAASLFSLLNRTRSPPGARLLRAWTRFPSTEPGVIRDRHDHVAFFANPYNDDLTARLRLHLRRVRDVSRVLTRFFTATARARDWAALAASLQAFVAVHALAAARGAAAAAAGAAPLPRLLRLLPGALSEPVRALNALLSATLQFTGARSAAAAAAAAAPASAYSADVAADVADAAEAAAAAAMAAAAAGGGPADRAAAAAAAAEAAAGAGAPAGGSGSRRRGAASSAAPSAGAGGDVVVSVRHGVEPQLDALKARLALIDPFLAEVFAADAAAGELPVQALPPAGAAGAEPVATPGGGTVGPQYCYFPQLGYLLAAPCGPAEGPAADAYRAAAGAVAERQLARAHARAACAWSADAEAAFVREVGTVLGEAADAVERAQWAEHQHAVHQYQQHVQQQQQQLQQHGGYAPPPPPPVAPAYLPAPPPLEPELLPPGARLELVAEGYAFYATPRTDELARELGDLHAQIADAEREVLLHLADAVTDAAADVEAVAAAAAELDAVIALAVAARDLGLVRPAVTRRRGVLLVEDGRHPLAELAVNAFVPNSLSIGSDAGGGADAAGAGAGSSAVRRSRSAPGAGAGAGAGANDAEENADADADGDDPHADAGRVHVLTGPNNSGKSVLLRQLGVIAYLAHIGSFVPARAVTVGVCDRIVLCAPAADTAGRGVSTFAAEVAALGRALRAATGATLLLVDEFGAGTNTADGVALAAATLRYLARLPARQCPMTVFTTHFHQIRARGLLAESRRVRFVSMQYVTRAAANAAGNTAGRRAGQEQARGEVAEDEALAETAADIAAAAAAAVVPLYRVGPGWGGRSFGFSCARAAGVPAPLVARAVAVAAAMHEGRPVAPTSLSACELSGVVKAEPKTGPAAAAAGGCDSATVDENAGNSCNADNAGRAPGASGSGSAGGLAAVAADLRRHAPVLEAFAELAPRLAAGGPAARAAVEAFTAGVRSHCAALAAEARAAERSGKSEWGGPQSPPPPQQQQQQAYGWDGSFSAAAAGPIVIGSPGLGSPQLLLSPSPASGNGHGSTNWGRGFTVGVGFSGRGFGGGGDFDFATRSANSASGSGSAAAGAATSATATEGTPRVLVSKGGVKVEDVD